MSEDIGRSVVAALGEPAARELLEILDRSDADRAALIGRLQPGRCAVARRAADRPRGRRGRDRTAAAGGSPPAAGRRVVTKLNELPCTLTDAVTHWLYAI